MNLPACTVSYTRPSTVSNGYLTMLGILILFILGALSIGVSMLFGAMARKGRGE